MLTFFDLDEYVFEFKIYSSTFSTEKYFRGEAQTSAYQGKLSLATKSKGNRGISRAVVNVI